MSSTAAADGDKLSFLPLPLRHRILSFLPLEETIKLTTLSTRWRTVCSQLTHYEFNQNYFNNSRLIYELYFKDFVYQTLIQHNASDIVNFKLAVEVDKYNMVDVNSWISFAIKHNVEVLDVTALSGRLENLPCCLFTSNKLLGLSLNNVSIKLPLIYKGFANLRRLSVVSVEFWGDNHAIKLFSSCPLLEELSVIGCYFKSVDVFRFKAPKLKFLKLVGLSRFQEIGLSFPSLGRIVYEGKPPSVCLEMLKSLYNAEFCLAMPPQSADGESRDLIEHRTIMILEGLVNVRRLTLEGLCIEFLTSDPDLFARLPSSYCCLNHLKLEFYPDKNQVEVVMFLLRRCPNLQTLSISIKTLTLLKMFKKGEHRQSPASSTESTLDCLRKVEIKYFGGSDTELDLVKFLLGNGTVMEEMHITYSRHKFATKERRESIKKKLVTFATASPQVALSFRQSFQMC